MDIISAYREVGTYRGAAEVTGTTHKTVRRVIARHGAGGAALERASRCHNYDDVADLVAERVGAWTKDADEILTRVKRAKTKANPLTCH